jgi:hypothetical protein
VSAAAQRRWKWSVLTGIAAWIRVTVLVAVVNDDPSDGTPVLLTFAAGGGLFFGAVFGVALWETRSRTNLELDRVYAELVVGSTPASSASRVLGGMRTAARIYVVLGAIVTGLGLLAIVQQALEIGNASTTLYVMVAIVVAWAAAVPLVLRRANAASVAVLEPLGLHQNGTVMTGERHGRQVSIEITSAGSVTRVKGDGEPIVIRRKGHEGPSWLLDLAEAERQASER